MKTIILFIFTIFAISGLYSCNQKSAKSRPGQDEVSEIEKVNPDKVELSEEQVKQAGVTMGQLVKKQMQKQVSVNGTIRLLPNYLASVSPFASGNVEMINCQEGSHVQKGAILCSLKHPEYIQFQQDFLGAKGRFDYLKKELQRQKILSEANVSAQKRYQQTQSEYETARGMYFAAREKLKFLGISPADVQAGNIQNSIYLKAPISGTVSQINIHKGELINPQRVAFEIADNSKLYARLTVFEKDINQIHVGETFVFSVPAFNDSLRYHGEITGIDRVLNPKTKSMMVTGKIEPAGVLAPGLYIEARVRSPKNEVYALPAGAVVRDKNAEYIFIYVRKQKERTGRESVVFKKTRVNTGIRNEDFIQVLSPDSLLNKKNIVLTGAFFLKAEMNKGEGDPD